MAERGISPKSTNSVDLGSSSKKWRKLYAQSIDSPRFRSTSTAYAVGDFCFLSIVEPVKLVCVAAGTSGSGALSLSSTAEGAVVTDGSVKWAIDGFADGNYSPFHHNGIYRGANITDYYDSGLYSANLLNGCFANVYPGDYIVKNVTVDGTTYSNQKVNIGDLDYFMGLGITPVSNHHALAIFDEPIGIAQMNESNISTGAFAGTKLNQNTLPLYDAAVKNAFGAAHVLSHSEQISSGNSTALASMAGAGKVGCSTQQDMTPDRFTMIPNEVMLLGTMIASSSMYDVGYCNRQIALYTFIKPKFSDHVWIRAVVTDGAFAYYSKSGMPESHVAAFSHGVLPYFLLI